MPPSAVVLLCCMIKESISQTLNTTAIHQHGFYFNQSIKSYIVPFRSLLSRDLEQLSLRGAPDPSQAEKNSLEKAVELRNLFVVIAFNSSVNVWHGSQCVAWQTICCMADNMWHGSQCKLMHKSLVTLHYIIMFTIRN